MKCDFVLADMAHRLYILAGICYIRQQKAAQKPPNKKNRYRAKKCLRTVLVLYLSRSFLRAIRTPPQSRALSDLKVLRNRHRRSRPLATHIKLRIPRRFPFISPSSIKFPHPTRIRFLLLGTSQYFWYLQNPE